MPRSLLSAVYKLIEGVASPTAAGDLLAEANLTGSQEGMFLLADLAVTGDFTGDGEVEAGCPRVANFAAQVYEDWLDSGPGFDGYFLDVVPLIVPQANGTPFALSITLSNSSYGAITGPFPDTIRNLTVTIEHRLTTPTPRNVQQNKWSYVYFENIPYWETHGVELDWAAPPDASLFDPDLAGGVEILCAGGPGDREDQFDGTSAALNTYGDSYNTGTGASNNPELVPLTYEVLATITEEGDLPLTLPAMPGKAFIIRTVNQDPSSVPGGAMAGEGTWVIGDFTATVVSV